MPDPIGASALKAATAIAAPLTKAAKREWDRRNADEASTDLTSLAPQMEEALEVLTQPEARLDKALWNKIKGVISGRPPIFDHPPIRRWLETPSVREAIRTAAAAEMQGDDVQPALNAILAAYQPEAGGDRSEAAPALDYATAFIILSIGRDVGPGDRLLLAADRKTQAMIADLATQIGDAAAQPVGVPLELVDGYVAEAVDALRKKRFLLPAGIAESAKSLGFRLLDRGDLSATSPTLRARALASCARWLSASPEDADHLLSASSSFETTQEGVIAEAFRLSRTGWVEAFAALKPIDTMEKRTASVFIHRQHHSHEETLAWLDQARIGWENLNGDGRYILLQMLTLADRWDGALELVHGLTDEDLEETPALNLLAAIICVASQTPADLRHILIAGAIPMNPRGFPIADTPSALVERRAAEQYFRKAAEAMRWAGNTVGSRQFAAMALWLKLRDPAAADSAAREVGDALDDPDRAITVLPLALDFDLPLNLEEVERSLGALEALNPTGDFDLAFARLFLTQGQGSLAEQHAYFQRHKAMLHRHLAVLGLTDFEIRLLIHDGRSEKARELLAAITDQLDPADVRKFQDLISDGPGGRSLAALEADYSLTPGLPALGRLVEALIPEGFSERLFGLWLQLVKTTQVQTDAETLVRFLIQNHRWAEIDQVLADTSTLAEGSTALQSALAWSHFRAGRFNDSRSVLAILRRVREDANDRALHVNLVIASGRWPELATFVEQEWSLKDQRTAEELLGIAELASRIGSPRLTDLLEKAASLEPDNPHILIACYSLAVRGGIEAVSQTHGWLQTAIRTSDEEGPVQNADLKTLIDQAPEWDARVDQISDQLRRGELPMAIAAPGLRRSPLELQMVPMLANPGQTDPRRRSVVPAYSGVRSQPELTATRVGLDLTAIVTLAVLDLLDPVIAQGGVTIAHGTLRHLFEDRQKLAFHQPSRIQFAHALTRWMATGKLQRFTPTAEAAPALIGNVGQGLAEMLAEAKDQSHGASPRRYVIRSNPVQKVGSFSGEAVGLDDYYDVLRGCGAVLEKLQDAGLLTGGEYSQARAYLDHQGETPWRDGEDIDSGADLFLDDLSVDYLNTMGVLDQLGAAGLRAFVSAREIGEANAFLELEARSDEIERVIERMRANLSGAIETGQVSVSPEADEIELPRIGEVFQTLPPLVDALVCDDRFLNQHPVMSTPDGQTPIWTSLDLIDRLQQSGVISESERSTYRMTLRRAGLAVFPLESNELADHVAAARVKDGRLVENGELRAFRENLSLSQMRGWLRLPQEWGWLANLSSVLLDLIGRQWRPGIPDEDSRGRSEWLLELADLRNWSGCFDEGSGMGMGMAEKGRVQQVVKLLISNTVSEDVDTNKRYAWWLENVVGTIKQAEPALYGWIMTSLRDLVILHQEREAGDDA